MESKESDLREGKNQRIEEMEKLIFNIIYVYYIY